MEMGVVASVFISGIRKEIVYDLFGREQASLNKNVRVHTLT